MVDNYIPARKRIRTLLERNATWDEISALYGVNKGTLWKYYHKGTAPRSKWIRRRMGLINLGLGAIRIDFENGTDPHQARALIINKLSTKERGEILLENAKEK